MAFTALRRVSTKIHHLWHKITKKTPASAAAAAETKGKEKEKEKESKKEEKEEVAAVPAPAAAPEWRPGHHRQRARGQLEFSEELLLDLRGGTIVRLPPPVVWANYQRVRA